MKKGISAVIPTYKGESYISKLLDSIVAQTIDFELFEAILIVNGELDNTPEIIKKYQKDYPEVNLILTESEKGVSNARNKGIELASREYLIFIDDDDYISENYFEVLFKHAKKGRIVVGTFLDVKKDGEITESYLTPPLLRDEGIDENPYRDEMTGILAITQDKLIPTENVKKTLFNPKLKNGVDISYYARFYAENDFEFYIVNKDDNCIYYRVIRDNSISRKALSYDFNVKDRLGVIADINIGIKKAKSQKVRSFIESFSGGQVVKINEYLEKYPKDYVKTLKDILSYDFDFFPYKYLNEDLSNLNNENRELIISYAFSPTNTTTSNVVAKRILSEKKNVDVVCGSLNNIKKDESLDKVVNEFIVNKYTIDCDFSTDWDNIKNFTKKALDLLPKYDKIYSRANFVHSHFLAFEYKLKNPDTYWRAEFSDPLIYTFDKRHLSAKLNDNEYIDRINEILKKNNFKEISKDDDINCVCEYLTFLFADEVIFTNTNQKDVMLHDNPYEVSINNFKISPHPTLDKKYYYVKKSDYEVDDNYINFAYFGVIFSNRSFEDFISAYDNIKDKSKVKLHIFTPNITLFEQVLSSELYENTTINENVDYLEFLNLTNKFDVLIVEDSYTKGDFIKNPYLPSKISDYKNSDAKTWAICEKESVLSKEDVDFKSYIGDINSNIKTLNEILNNDSQQEIDVSEYQRERINQLTEKITQLISVCENEFIKDENYKKEIKELEKLNSKILNSNSWKLTSNFRKLGKKFK